MSVKIHEQGYSYIVIDDKPLEDARPPFLVDGIVASTLTLLYGAPKTGKSTIAAALSVAIANGTPFLNQPVNASGKVAIITGDPGDDDYYASMFYGKVPSGTVRPYAFSRPPMQETWAKVCYEIQREQVTLVIIDNLVAFVPGDVNDHRPVRIFHDTAIDPLVRAGIAVVLIHHTSEKRGEHGVSKTPMGNTAISAAARWKVRVETPDVAGPTKLVLEGNYGPTHELIVTRPDGTANFEVIDAVEAGELARWKMERNAGTVARRAEYREYVLAECQGLNQTKTAEKLAEKYGGTKGTHTVMLSKGAYGVHRVGDQWERSGLRSVS